LAPDKGLRE
jgi:DNA-directed RNA polymerase specialized sigma24 family protein